MDYQTREAQAMAMYKQGIFNVKNNKEPKGQKFPVGSRVHIAPNLGRVMSQFESDCDATVMHTHTHAYGGSNVKSYCLDVDGCGQIAWYTEDQLTLLDNKKPAKDE